MVFSENHYFLVPLIFVSTFNLSRCQWSWGLWGQYDDGDLDYLDSESNMSETEAETNEVAAGRNKRKSSIDLNTDADDQSGKKPSKTKKKMTFQEQALEV